MLYVQHFEEEKKKEVLSEAEVQASAISSDIYVLSQKCKQMKSAMQMMNDEFVEFMKLAEQKNDMSFVIKGNRRKRESEDLQKTQASILAKSAPTPHHPLGGGGEGGGGD